MTPWQSADAAESGLSTYGLGSAAFGAGQTPPPGSYVSFIGAYYAADIGGALTIGGESLDLGATIDLLFASINGMHVLDTTLLGGRPTLSVTLPFGYDDLRADASIDNLRRTREVEGTGFGDMTARFQLGWDHTDFSHLVYVQAVAPTGRYDLGFQPDIGLNRPGIDLGWAFTWTETTFQLQFNGSFGVSFNARNDKTEYKTGNEFHFEWAVGHQISPGLLVGIVGYDYRQLTGDSGAGARLGPFKGDVDAIGAGVSYTTLVETTPLILNIRHYEEFNAERRWDGSMTILSGTIRF